MIDAVFAQSATVFATDPGHKGRTVHPARAAIAATWRWAKRLDRGKPGDVKEAFNIGWDLPADHPDVIAYKPFRGVNVWPGEQQLPAFGRRCSRYFDACHRLGMRACIGRWHTTFGAAENSSTTNFDQPLATGCVCCTIRRVPTALSRARRVRASTPTTATSRCWRPTMPAGWKCVRGMGSGFRHRPSRRPDLQHWRLPDALDQRRLRVDAASRGQSGRP